MSFHNFNFPNSGLTLKYHAQKDESNENQILILVMK